jgi:hypothetical protein
VYPINFAIARYDLGREGAFVGFSIAIFNGIARDKAIPDQFMYVRHVQIWLRLIFVVI